MARRFVLASLALLSFLALLVGYASFHGQTSPVHEISYDLPASQDPSRFTDIWLTLRHGYLYAGVRSIGVYSFLAQVPSGWTNPINLGSFSEAIGGVTAPNGWLILIGSNHEDVGIFDFNGDRASLVAPVGATALVDIHADYPADACSSNTALGFVGVARVGEAYRSYYVLYNLENGQVSGSSYDYFTDTFNYYGGGPRYVGVDCSGGRMYYYGIESTGRYVRVFYGAQGGANEAYRVDSSLETYGFFVHAEGNSVFFGGMNTDGALDVRVYDINSGEVSVYDLRDVNGLEGYSLADARAKYLDGYVYFFGYYINDNSGKFVYGVYRLSDKNLMYFRVVDAPNNIPPTHIRFVAVRDEYNGAQYDAAAFAYVRNGRLFVTVFYQFVPRTVDPAVDVKSVSFAGGSIVADVNVYDTHDPSADYNISLSYWVMEGNQVVRTGVLAPAALGDANYTVDVGDLPAGDYRFCVSVSVASPLVDANVDNSTACASFVVSPAAPPSGGGGAPASSPAPSQTSASPPSQQQSGGALSVVSFPRGALGILGVILSLLALLLWLFG